MKIGGGQDFVERSWLVIGFFSCYPRGSQRKSGDSKRRGDIKILVAQKYLGMSDLEAIFCT